jgi:hypothetical protein
MVLFTVFTFAVVFFAIAVKMPKMSTKISRIVNTTKTEMPAKSHICGSDIDSNCILYSILKTLPSLPLKGRRKVSL